MEHGPAQQRPTAQRPPQRDADQSDAPDAAADLVAGRKPVLELLAQQPDRVESVVLARGLRGEAVDRILELCRSAGVRYRMAEQGEMSRLFPGVTQGVVARVFGGGFVELDELLDAAAQAPLPLVAALDQVQDPGNVGTLARSLYALGAGGLLLPKHHAARLGGAASRAAAGALLKLPVAREPNLSRALEMCRDAGFTIYAAQGASTGTSGGDAPRDARATLPAMSAWDINPVFPAVLVLGGEEGGIRPGVAKRCDAAVYIPMARPFDSLNVAQAGAILLGRLAAHRGAS